MNAKNHLKQLITDPVNGEIICNCCGLVVEQKTISTTALDSAAHSFWGVKSDHDSPRMGITSLSVSHQLVGAIIPKTTYDYAGNKLNNQTISQSFRFRSEQNRANIPAGEMRRLWDKLTYLREACDKLGVPYKLQEQAAYNIRKCLKHSIHKGANRAALISAHIFLVYKLANNPRRLDEILQVLGETNHRNLAFRYARSIQTMLAIPVYDNIQNCAIKLVVDCCIHLKCNTVIRDTALKFLDVYLKSSESTGRTPAVKAGIAIHFALLQHQTKNRAIKSIKRSQVSDYLKVTEASIQMSYRELKNNWMIVHRDELMTCK